MRNVSPSSVRTGGVTAAVLAMLFFASVAMAAANPTSEGPRLVAPTIPPSTIDARWRLVSTMGPADDSAALGPLHIYLDLDAAPAAAQRLAARCIDDHADLAARVACKTAALGPNATERTALAAWLAPLGSTTLTHTEYRAKSARGCHIGWNAVHCRGATVGAAKRAFGDRLTFRRMFKKDKASAKKGSLFTVQSLAVPSALAARVIRISGLQPYDWHEASGRHMGRTNQRASPRPLVVAEKRRDNHAAPKAYANSGTLDPTPYADYEWIGNTYLSENQWGSDTPGQATPRLFHLSSLFAYVMPVCGDGYAPSASNLPGYPPSWSALCGVHTPAPTTVAVIVTRVGDGAVVFTGDVSAEHCASASNYDSSSPSIICRIYVASAFVGAANWQQYTASVTQTFAATATTVTGNYQNFMSGITYTVGSMDVNDAVITNPVATPTLTVPSSSYVTPSVIFAQYDVPSSARADSVVQGVVEFTDVDEPGQGFDSSDLSAYLNNIANIPGDSSSLWQVVGDQTIVSQGETTLDIELIMGIARGAKSYVNCISYGDDGDYATYADALSGFASTAMGAVGTLGVASVWSISYGGPEWTTDVSLMRHLSGLFGHLTDAGITVTASSGDSGCYFIGQDVYHSANWPATSPYVVGVGASAFTAAQTPGAAPLEHVCNVRDGNIITSGGGFSQVFSVPDYQKAFVSGGFLGMPDVSAVGAWIATIIGGQSEPLFGTSASSPIFAALISLANQQRLNQYAANSSMPSGTLRQAPAFLYNAHYNTRGAAYYDVFVGDNCNGEQIQGLSGNFPTFSRAGCYVARTGWDAVTGLGTPSYRELLPQAVSWNPSPLSLDPKSSDTQDAIIGGAVIGAVVVGCVAAFVVCRCRRRRVTLDNLQLQHPIAPVVGTAYQAYPVQGQPVAYQHAGNIYDDSAV